MSVFNHLLYEYKKGLRDLALHTCDSSHQPAIEAKLSHLQIDYIIQHVTEEKINVFFGATPCIDIIRLYGNKRLHEYNAEEDFILGIMLGYNRLEQCRRYMKNKKHAIKKEIFCARKNVSLIFNSLN